MKRIVSLLALAMLVATSVAAQTEAPSRPIFNSSRDYRSRVFTVVHRDPNMIASAVRLLGSGFEGTAISVNDELRTITVRDFPENIATIEEAIGRLDQPAAKEDDIMLTVSVLIGSRSPLKDASVPEDLAPVVRQLQSALTYGHYGLM